MILQSLDRYYNILAKDPDIPIARFGYSTIGISFALNIDFDGELLDIFPQFRQEMRGKKSVDVPKPMVVPEQAKRTVGVVANFLWDNATYVLGISNQDDEKPAYSRDRHAAFVELHKRLLTNVDTDGAAALLRFLDRFDPASAREHPVIAPYLEGLLGGGNIVFTFEGTPLHRDRTILKAWEESKAAGEAELMQCLVTGEITRIARLHPNLKRVRNAQPAGATLVGFNAQAYESYNRKQGLNSPVGEPATFAYTTVLNYLLSDANPNKKFAMGDATVVYWAESENREYERAVSSLIEPPLVEVEEPENEARKKAEGALKGVAEKVKRVQALEIKDLLRSLQGDNPRFYVLGLAPNAARISVRFFVAEPFTEVVDNIMAHYRDLEIVKEFDNQPSYITIGHILSETVSKKSRDKDASPLMAGAVLRSILTDQPYPAALYYAVINRVRTDMDDAQLRIQKVGYVRAAIIKAYLLRKYRFQPDSQAKEVLTVSLNASSTNTAYLLGRLFAVLEKAQRDAIGKDINATIKDRYFATACGSPRSVFPTLLRLSQHHFSKIGKQFADRDVQAILDLLEVDRDPYPARLSLDEQGIFILGYYQQRAVLYTKRSKKESDSADEPETADESAESVVLD